MDQYQLQQLRQLPIEQVAQQLGIEVTRHKALCPFHQDHHPSLSFHTPSNTCRCFTCMDHSIGTIDLVMKYRHLTFLQACQYLGAPETRTLPTPLKGGPLTNERTLPTPLKGGPLTNDSLRPHGGHPPFKGGLEGPPRWFEHPFLNDTALQFLIKERHIDTRVIRYCRLNSYTDRNGTPWLQIPYYNLNGQLIGVQSRNLSNQQPRFRFLQGSQTTIYNIQVLNTIHPSPNTIQPSPPPTPVYIAEGPSDCWALLSAGHKAIAIPSATLLKPTDKQLLQNLTRQYNIQWHMYPDQDTPGQRLYLQLKETLPDLQHHPLPPQCKDFAQYYASMKVEG